MNNSIKGKNLEEITIQLKRAELQKKNLIKNIYKEYEIYFQIVRKALLPSVEKGISTLYSNLTINDQVLNTKELSTFLNKNISLLIHSKLPLITIEQLKLGDIRESRKKLVDINAFKGLIEFKEDQTIKFEKENDSNSKESLEFYCNNNSNIYEYYESLSEDKLLSVNLDENGYFNTFLKQKSIKIIEDEKHLVDSLIELIEESKDNKSNDYENTNDQLTDVFLPINNLNLFEIVDKSFSNLLLNLSYKINSELFKINLIKNIISEDTFKCLSNNNYVIRHPCAFVIGYNLNQKKLSLENINYSDIFLFNITNVELEFFNLDLSICRNSINELKQKFLLLNKKQRYWQNKELSINN